MIVLLITKVEKNRDKEKTYSIFIDGNFSFNVSQYDIHKFAIYEGRELNIEELAWIKHQARFVHAKSIALSFIAYKLRTAFEVKRKLGDAGIDYEIIEEVVGYLTENGYLNDQSYAEKFIAEKSKLSSLSDKVLLYKLREKGIPQEVIDNVLRGQSHDEKESAKKLIAKRIKGLGLDKKLEIKELLYKKGFSFQTINEVLSELND